MFLVTLLAAAALQAPQAAAYPTDTSPATAEGVEILRRLLAEGIDRLFERKDPEPNPGDMTFRRDGFGGNGFVTTLWASESTVQHSRAFHVPDAGLFLTLDASLPLVAREVVASDDEPEGATDDEWERIRRELRGDLPSAPGAGLYHLRLSAPRQDLEIDPKAIDKVVDGVLQTVARHGVRVEGLGQQDTITVALRLTGKHRAWLQDVEEGEPADLVAPDGEAPVTRTFSAYVLATGHETKPQNLVIRIAVADLAGQPTLERLRQRARINRY
jgi:hypothetical protein